MIDLSGKVLLTKSVSTQTEPNTSKKVTVVPGVGNITDVAFLRLILSDEDGEALSRNVYWLSSKLDKLDWDHSTWFYTPVKKWSDLKSLQNLETASVSVTVGAARSGASRVMLKNEAEVPAFFIRLNLVDTDGNDIVPVLWSDNYVTLWPHESMELTVSYEASGGASVEASGWNFGPMQTIQMT